MRIKHRHRILVRVDSGNRIGMGHIIECLSLLKSLKERAEIEAVFLTRKYLPGIEKIKESGFIIKIIPEETNVYKDVKNVLNIAKEFRPDVFIIDLLRMDRVDKGTVILNNKYLQQLEGKGFILVSILDDALLNKVSADLIVNFHICQDKTHYSRWKEKDKYLVGPPFVLLEESYHRFWKQNKRIPFKCENIFVNQGGSDPYGLTAKILNALQKLFITTEVNVVIGNAMKKEHLDNIMNVRNRLPGNYKFNFDLSVHKMQKLMEKADLAITAAGNTLYELCALGVPSLIISHHKDHDVVAQELEEKVAAINLGIGTEIFEDTICYYVNMLCEDRELRRSLSRNAKKITDGYGAVRVAERIISLMENGR